MSNRPRFMVCHGVWSVRLPLSLVGVLLQLYSVYTLVDVDYCDVCNPCTLLTPQRKLVVCGRSAFPRLVDQSLLISSVEQAGFLLALIITATPTTLPTRRRRGHVLSHPGREPWRDRMPCDAHGKAHGHRDSRRLL